MATVSDPTKIKNPLDLVNRPALEAINPGAVLQSLGFTASQMAGVFDGDFAAAAEAAGKIKPMIDLEAVHRSNLSNESVELLEWFFLKAAKKEEFTRKEATSTRSAYLRMFDVCFKAARSAGFAFTIDEANPENESLLIRAAGSCFMMTMVGEDRLIMHLPSFE